jgi:hypothetical protein
LQRLFRKVKENSLIFDNKCYNLVAKLIANIL